MAWSFTWWGRGVGGMGMGLANGMGAAGKHLGGFAGGQTAGLNHHKRTMPGLANGMGAARKHLVGFAGWQTAGLNHHKRTMPGLANGMGAAGKHLGGLGLNHHKRTMPELANGMGAAGKHLGGFAGWQTAGLNSLKKAFLHGCPTPVPGSWNGHRLECNHATCQKLLREKAAPEAILRLECDICKKERQSKARVADGSIAAAAKFAGAKAIFATNAVKYHVNKLRAKVWAAETGQVLHHAIAKDRISSAALREKPDLGKEKLTWLQRHDQDCGSLYHGVFPSVHWYASCCRRSLGS